MNGNKLQAALARRREIQQIKFDKLTANDKYFDKWGRITSRYEQWTAPTYYEQKNQDLKNEQQTKLKSVTLDSRRKQLKELLDNESEQYKNELFNIKNYNNNNKRSTTNQISNDILNGINMTFKKQRSEEDKRRLHLESNLYRKWRNQSASNQRTPTNTAINESSILESRESSILYNSKSDHQALAKMNWLDKQVAAQLERDREQKEMEERHLRIQEETRKQMELSNERKSAANKEITALQLFVETNLNELKERELEMKELTTIELGIKKRKNEMLSEWEQFQMVQQNREKQFFQSELYSSSSSSPSSSNLSFTNYNTRRIKLIYHEYSKLICLNLRLDIDLLKRIQLLMSSYAAVGAPGATADNSQFIFQKTQSICEHFQRVLQDELEKQKQIECMYESEAKHNLIKQKECWMTEQMTRDKSIKNLFDEYLKSIDDQLLMNIEQQNRLCDIKENHLIVIENTNKNIKRLLDPIEFTGTAREDGGHHQNNNLSKLSTTTDDYDSFNMAMKTMNIKNNSTNLRDCLTIRNNSNGQQQQQQPGQQQQQQQQKSPNQQQENVMQIPKFGRKKIAWT